MTQQGVRVKRAGGCSRTQLLLLILLFPALLVFVYFIHHTHLTHPHIADISSDVHAIVTLNSESTSTLTIGKPISHNVDKAAQLQKFKSQGKKHAGKDEIKSNSSQKNKGKPSDHSKAHSKGDKRKKADDDTPSVHSNEQSTKTNASPQKNKKIAPHLLDVREEEGIEEVSYSQILEAEEKESEDDDSQQGEDGEEMEEDKEMTDTQQETITETEVDPVYGEIDRSDKTVESKSENAESGDDEEEESDAKKAVYYIGGDDDEKTEPVVKNGGSMSTSKSSKQSYRDNKRKESLEIDSVKAVSTPPPTKKVYVPGYKDKEKMKKLRAHSTNKLFNYQPEWGYNGEFKHIQVLPTLKIPLKKDRRVVFPNLSIERPSRNPDDLPSGIPGESRELRKANAILQTHPLYGKPEWYDGQHSLEEVMAYIQQSPYCLHQKPIFLSMATVHDDLYWQLIENFVYTMVKFNTSQCSLVICVSDPNCMKMCGSSYFPCYNYVEVNRPLPSVMEQIAKVKLFYVPKALTMGVDVFMLDLDVGFLGDPNFMIQAFYETPIVDIMVQEDYIFIMNRTKAGWKQWFTEPLPNIGLFLCRGNNKTARVFEIAWQKYLVMDDPWEKAQPGKDQNHVLDAMRIGRGEFGLKYAYFSNATAPLLDKLVLNHGNVMELGGELMEDFLMKHQSLAMHTTCYEKSTKVMGLKASNSFWNPRYYDSLRKTITKQILFKNDGQLLDEVRSMVWLAIATERSLILPNILGSESIHTIDKYKGQAMWPGFRVTFLKRSKGRNELKVQILEPNFYWRVNRDYDAIPEPEIIYFDPDKDSLVDIKEKLEAVKDIPRIVLHHRPSSRRQPSAEDEEHLQVALQVWANDSVGLFHQPYSQLVKSYRAIPSVKGIRSGGAPLVDEVLQGMRNCANIFGPHKGNRTCFQVCD